MRGLLYKDFFVMKKDLLLGGIGILLFSLPLFMPWGKILKANQISPEILTVESMTYVFLPVFVYFAVFEVISAVQSGIFSHDERREWRAYILASPLGAKGQVFSKYCITLGLSFAALLWGYVCDAVSMLVSGTRGSASMIYTALFFIQIVLRALELPFFIRFGQKYGRTYKIFALSFLLFAGGVYALFGKLPDTMSLEGGFDWILRLQRGQTICSVWSRGEGLLPLCAAMLLYGLSYQISCGLYRKAFLF